MPANTAQHAMLDCPCTTKKCSHIHITFGTPPHKIGCPFCKPLKLTTALPWKKNLPCEPTFAYTSAMISELFIIQTAITKQKVTQSNWPDLIWLCEGQCELNWISLSISNVYFSSRHILLFTYFRNSNILLTFHCFKSDSCFFLKSQYFTLNKLQTAKLVIDTAGKLFTLLLALFLYLPHSVNLDGNSPLHGWSHSLYRKLYDRHWPRAGGSSSSSGPGHSSLTPGSASLFPVLK